MEGFVLKKNYHILLKSNNNNNNNNNNNFINVLFTYQHTIYKRINK